MSCDIHPRMLVYMQAVESGEIRACEEQKLLMQLVRKSYATEPVYIDTVQLEHYLGLVKYFQFERLFPWEEFLIGLELCTYWEESGLPRWPDGFHLLGRGAGKDGLISFDALCAISPYNGIRAYDVDVCANNHEQAVRPVLDLVEALEQPENIRKLKKHFRWTKETVRGLKTGSIVKGHTNNPSGRDGLRSGWVIFNEIHEYKNYKNIDVFTTGLGKKDHPRRSWFTTDGNVREGPLDDYKETCQKILRQGEPDNGFLPFICKLDCEEDVHDEKNWEKANPSLPYKPSLMEEMRKEYREWREKPEQLPAFMTKRMNLPRGREDQQVAAYEKIKATNKPLPLEEMRGWRCTIGIDYASLRDFASVVMHFKRSNQRYDLHHSWFNANSLDRSRIQAPLADWADSKKWGGHPLLTFVDDIEIQPKLITEYISHTLETYGITAVELALDKFRLELLRGALREIGFDTDVHKNIKLVRPSDIMAVQPVVASCFDNELFAWGNDPALRWATNNTKLVRRGKEEGTDTGSFYYAKIEAKSRKTDPFMALVAAMTVENKLDTGAPVSSWSMGVIGA